jgi:acetyl esterase/lipase
MSDSPKEQIRSLLLSMKNAPMPESIEELRENVEKMMSQSHLSPDISIEPIDINGIAGEWVSATESSNEHAMLYLHGGGYILGSSRTYRDLTSRIAAAAGVRVMVIDYRLAPENQFPAAIEDAVNAYRWLINNGFKPENIAIGGDSAGGGLTLATLLSLRDAGESLPAVAALISPWTDLAGTGESLVKLAETDPWLNPHSLLPMAGLYLGETDARNPLASPLYADLQGLPPLLIQVGTDEILLDDSTRLAQRALAANVTTTLDVWQDMWHVWHLFAEQLPEGQQAIGKMAEFIRSNIFDEIEKN